MNNDRKLVRFPIVYFGTSQNLQTCFPMFWTQLRTPKIFRTQFRISISFRTFDRNLTEVLSFSCQTFGLIFSFRTSSEDCSKSSLVSERSFGTCQNFVFFLFMTIGTSFGNPSESERVPPLFKPPIVGSFAHSDSCPPPPIVDFLPIKLQIDLGMLWFTFHYG